jgi:ATP-dependent Clp protease protease subunit
MPKPWFRVVNLTTTATGENGASERRARLDIFDQIGESTDWWAGETAGIAARDFSTSLLALGELDVIELHINSPGGSIFDGWQIFNELKRHPARVDVLIDGQAASMASVIAMVGDSVTMPANATLWVHNPMTTFMAWTTGYSTDMRKIAQDALRTADDLDTDGQALLNAYVTRSGGKVTADAMRALMDVETLITAERAVELGLADAIEEPLEAAACFDMANILGTSAGCSRAPSRPPAGARRRSPPAP